MKCETYLRTRCKNQEFPFLIFRLPDVVGPYDCTNRFWAYQNYFQKMLTWTLRVVIFSKLFVKLTSKKKKWRTD